MSELGDRLKILIAGSTGGIGGAIKAAAQAHGLEVHSFDRADFAALDDKAENIPSDLDAVVFATGKCEIRPLGMTTDEMFADNFSVNCGLFVRLMRAIVKGKRYNPGGMKVIAISSVSANEGWAGGVAYCASKGALSAVARAMNAELSPRKISVMAMEPRYVRTRMFYEGAGRMGVDESEAMPPEEFAAMVIGKL